MSARIVLDPLLLALVIFAVGFVAGGLVSP